MTLSIRDLALKMSVKWEGRNRYTVTSSVTGRIYHVTVRWNQMADVEAITGNPVAQLAVEMYERARVAGRQFN